MTTKKFDRYPWLNQPIVSLKEPDEPEKITFDQFLDEVVFTGKTRRQHYLNDRIDLRMLRNIWNFAIEKGVKS